MSFDVYEIDIVLQVKRVPKGNYSLQLVVFPSTEGAQFFSLVKSLARRYGDNERLYFLWVDPDPFPTVSCARATEYSDTSFNVDKIGGKKYDNNT